MKPAFIPSDEIVPNNVVRINGRWKEAKPINPQKPIPLTELVRLCGLKLIDGKVST